MTVALMAWVPVGVVVLAACAIWVATGDGRDEDDSHVRWLSAIGLVGATATALVLWHRETPVGGRAIDHYALFFSILLCASVLWSVAVARSGSQGRRRWMLILLSVAAAMVAVAARDLVVLVTAIQAVSIGTGLLIASHSAESGRRLATRELVPPVLSGTIALYGVALMYALTGTTQIDDLLMRVAASSLRPSGLLLAALALTLIGVTWTAIVAPFRAYLAAGGAASVLALVALCSGSAGVMRVMFTAFEPIRPVWQPVMAVVAGVLMVGGALGAASQTGVRRVVAYLTIAQVGLLLTGVVAGGDLGRSAALFSLVGHGLASLAVGGAVVALLPATMPEDDLWEVAGLGYARPVLAGVLAAALLLLCGVPPGAGFVGRWLVVQGAMEEGQRTIGLVAAATGVVSVVVGLRLVVRMYQRGTPPPPSPVSEPPAVVAAVGLAVVLALLAGVMSGQLWRVVRDASGPLF